MQAVIDRIVQYPNRYQLTNAETGEVLGTFDFDEVTGTVQQVGTEIDAELFQSIADDLAARVKLSGGELAGTIVTFSDISGTAANVASGDTSATLWGKVKNWFSRLKALAFKNKVAAGDFEAGAIKNADVAADAAIAQSKISGLESSLAAKADDAALSTIAKTGNLSDAAEDATHRVVTDTEKATWNAKQNAITGAASTITKDNLTANRVLVSNGQGKVAVSAVTAKELGYLDGVTSNIQPQLDDIKDGTTVVGRAKNVTSQINGHAISDIFETDGTTVKEATQAEVANSVAVTLINSNNNINEMHGADYWGKEYYWAGGSTPIGAPAGLSSAHLSIQRAASGVTIQIIYSTGNDASSTDDVALMRTYQNNTWYDWKYFVFSKGSYPTLGAGHLPNNYIYAGGSSDPKWYKIATITNAPNLAAAGLLLSINGIFATQDYQYGAETGQIEFNAANASGTYSCSATLNYGNINTNNVCVVQNGSTAELYYHFDSNYQAILVTVMSFYGGSTASYELTNEGVSSAPSNAIYAVNRNVAAKVENALTIIKDGVSTVYDGSEAKTVEITENGGITVIEIPANDSGTLTSEQLQQVKNNPQNTVLRRTVSPEMNEIYCFDSVNMTQGADSAYTFRNVTSMAQNSLTLQVITVNLDSGLWIYSSVQTSAGGGGGSGITIVTIPQDGVSTNPVMSGTIELASPENTVIKIYNGEDNDGARYTYSILTSFDENASGDVPEYVYSGEDYIVTCKKSNGNTYNYTLTETPTPSVDITYATDSDIEALFSGGGVTDELLGTWVLNDSPSILFDERTKYNVSFTSNSSNFTSMSKDYTRTAPKLIYGDMTVCSNNSWTNTAYKTITITDTSNLTNREAFTTWLKANATKQ